MPWARGEMVDALVVTGGREQVAQMPNARHEGQERRHSRVFVTGRFSLSAVSAIDILQNSFLLLHGFAF